MVENILIFNFDFDLGNILLGAQPHPLRTLAHTTATQFLVTTDNSNNISSVCLRCTLPRHKSQKKKKKKEREKAQQAQPRPQQKQLCLMPFLPKMRVG